MQAFWLVFDIKSNHDRG